MQSKKIEEDENYRDEDGKLCVVRCPKCKRENYAPMVAKGKCAWCGWSEKNELEEIE